MSLTKQDKQDIAEIVDEKVGKAVSDLATIISDFATNVDQRFEQVDQRFEQVDKRLEGLEGRVGDIGSGLRETNLRLSAIESKLDSMDDRLLALENDIKEIYKMLNKKQDNLTTKSVLKLKGAEREQYIIDTYKMIVQIAKESHIKLPN